MGIIYVLCLLAPGCFKYYKSDKLSVNISLNQWTENNEHLQSNLTLYQGIQELRACIIVHNLTILHDLNDISFFADLTEMSFVTRFNSLFFIPILLQTLFFILYSLR